MLGIKKKYIILDGIIPVLFPEGVGHNEIAFGTRMIATSAGFVTLVPIQKNGRGYINSTVYGDSFSLGIGNKGDEDNKIIERFLNDTEKD